MKARPKSGPILSKLDAFCRANEIDTAALGRASGVSRQHALRARLGKSDVRIGYAKKLAKGASVLLRRKVAVVELFDLDFDFEPSQTETWKP